MSIAENIKRIRLEHGLSQAEFGKIAGVSDKAVSTWELGIKTPRMGAVEKMANYFGITKSAIVDDAQPTPSAASIPADYSKGNWLQTFAATPPDENPPEDKTALLEAFDKLNAEGRQKAVEYTEDLVLTGRYKKD